MPILGLVAMIFFTLRGTSASHVSKQLRPAFQEELDIVATKIRVSL
jgi:hypothetical protein